ncbi:bifunctional folylpolyglutamate synthase/dihydrofolate synthase [Desulfovibrio ferrophilus]|uniref:Dihydrofolate synthase/folylpolyglutamate synthase n=1 Tax=Desulfovibrio ferrophilus TaxID=241368 RepID=A0A2Z6AYY7_9BACT|nr:cyanophycin synthetase [Desulfovibrio ferrophilus]BBD08418.1 FolC bifunctional protein [Desulfovibrio ferrophilus]
MAHLDGLGMFHMELGLSRVAKALSTLGLTRPPYKVAHVVGTNGKGSTSRYLAEIASAHDLRVGLYSSPHFVTPRERVLVNGCMLSESSWTGLANEVFHASGDDGLTYFEFITVLAVLAFARAGVDVAVMEAGLGGRYDAANALETDLTVFTPVGLDHTQILGDTLDAIARDKAGAMRPGVLAVTAKQHPEAKSALMDVAARLRTALLDGVTAQGAVCPVLAPGMLGPHQIANARLAFAAWKLLTRSMHLSLDLEACIQGVSQARLPGRFQCISGEPELILDGAHNPQALDALAATLRTEGIEPQAVIFGCMQDKDLRSMAQQVQSLTQGPIFATGLPDMERAMASGPLAVALGERAHGVRDMAEALEHVASLNGPVLICGSLYLLGEFFALHPEHLGMHGPDVSI